MLYAGKKITETDKPLSKITIEYLYNAIKNPKIDIQAQIRNLRIIKSIDTQKYRTLKKELPYFVCSCFSPLLRHSKNFAYTQYFILDIDHLESKGLTADEIKQNFAQEPNILMAFTSPSNDGIKILFKFKERCYDAGLFSAFYKTFAKQFSSKWNLDQVIDKQTHDVTRACFISFDPDIYYNPNAEMIDITQYINLNDPFILQKNKELDHEFAQQKNTESSNGQELGTDTILKIKEILHLKKSKAEKQALYVPPQLDEIIGTLQKYLEGTGIKIDNITNISYGKKIQMSVGIRKAEVNLFYGKKGFSVVQSPRCGTQPELNQMTAELIDYYLMQL